MACADQASNAPSSTVATSTRNPNPSQPGSGRYEPARSKPINNQPALTKAPRPIDSARPAWPNSGTQTRFISCVSTSTVTAMRTGVRMFWRA